MLYNKTQNQLVFQGKSNWKTNPFCDCHTVMHRYDWPPTDEIYSFYNGAYKLFKYDKEKNEMIIDETQTHKPNIVQPLTVLDFGATDYQFEKQSLHVPIWGRGWECTICGYICYANHVTDDRKIMKFRKY